MTFKTLNCLGYSDTLKEEKREKRESQNVKNAVFKGKRKEHAQTNR